MCQHICMLEGVCGFGVVTEYTFTSNSTFPSYKAKWRKTFSITSLYTSLENELLESFIFGALLHVLAQPASLNQPFSYRLLQTADNHHCRVGGWWGAEIWESLQLHWRWIWSHAEIHKNVHTIWLGNFLGDTFYLFLSFHFIFPFLLFCLSSGKWGMIWVRPLSPTPSPSPSMPYHRQQRRHT